MDAARDAMHAAGQSSARDAVIGARRSGKPSRQAEPPALEHALGRLWDELRGLLHDQMLLVSLESQQALRQPGADPDPRGGLRSAAA